MPWEPLPGAKDREPERVSVPLDQLMDRLAGASVSAIEVVMDRWADIVGDAVAGVSAPVKLADGVLSVRVEQAELATELKWLEPTIIDRVRELAAGTELTGVRVVTRPR